MPQFQKSYLQKCPTLHFKMGQTQQNWFSAHNVIKNLHSSTFSGQKQNTVFFQQCKSYAYHYQIGNNTVHHLHTGGF